MDYLDENCLEIVLVYWLDFLMEYLLGRLCGENYGILDFNDFC